MKMNPGGRSCGRSWFPALLIVLGAVVLFFLRRSVVQLLPALLILAIFVPMIVYLYRRHLYRELEEVYEEYAPLDQLLRRRGLTTYRQLIGRSMTNLLQVRDRAESVAWLLAREDPQILYQRIVELRKTCEKSTESGQREMLEKQLRDMESNLENMRKLKRFLDKYQTSKKLLAGYFRSIHMKLQMDIISQEVSVSEQNQELEQVVADVENLTQVYERVDQMMEE